MWVQEVGLEAAILLRKRKSSMYPGIIFIKYYTKVRPRISAKINKLNLQQHRYCCHTICVG